MRRILERIYEFYVSLPDLRPRILAPNIKETFLIEKYVKDVVEEIATLKPLVLEISKISTKFYRR